MALVSRGMTVVAERQCEKNRKEWRARVLMYVIYVDHNIFLGFCVILDRLLPSGAWTDGWERVRGRRAIT